MYIKYDELCSTEFAFSEIVAYRMNDESNIEYNYENGGRTKHLLFCQLKEKRYYYYKNTHICTLVPGDIIFLPHGEKYRSYITDDTNDGIGISFNMFSPTGEPIFFDEGLKLFSLKNNSEIYKRLKKILYSVLNPSENLLRLKGEMYSLLDELFANKEKREDFDEVFKDIIAAVNILERTPENNCSVKELADLCHMSQSSFLRKFKDYSGGISPVKYRNNIRFMLAEELASSHLNMNEIAEKLGFYDGSHLCKMYKESKGYTLKKKSHTGV